MAEKKPGSMVIHLDQAGMLRMLSDKERGQLLLALIDYAQDGELPQHFKGRAALAFDVMRRAVDRNVARYNETCERNRALAMKRWHPEEAEGCEGMPAYAPDANSNPNVTPKKTQIKTVTPTVTPAKTQTPIEAETNIARVQTRRRELLERFKNGDLSAREELLAADAKLRDMLAVH